MEKIRDQGEFVDLTRIPVKEKTKQLTGTSPFPKKKFVEALEIFIFALKNILC